MIAQLRGRRAVIIGGGAVAERKTSGLLDAGADDVVVIAPHVTPQIERWSTEGRIRVVVRPYADGDLEDTSLAFAATDSEAANAAVAAEARRRGVWLNDTTQPARSDFSTPAVHRSGSLLVTVDTGGRAPALAKRVRDEVGAFVDERYRDAADALGDVRRIVRERATPEERAAIARRLANGAGDEAALVCASRASALAMTQTRTIVAELAAAGIPSTIHTVSTKGDRVQDRSLTAIGGDGVFVKELETALRDGRADYAVHSCKDLPSTLAEGMEIAAFTRRADPRDAFCSERFASFADLPAGARVGTSSPRRRAQLRALRDDLRYDEVRGNIDSRLRKLREGDYDALVLAMAGLQRLGIAATHTVPFDPAVIVPAVGQGALAIETRAGDAVADRLRAALEDPSTALAVRAERAFLRTLRGGCQAPVGAHATVAGAHVQISGAIASADGARVVRGARSVEAPSPAQCEALGEALATALLEEGGEAIVRAAESGPLGGRVMLLPRTQDRPSRIAPALREAGAEVIEVSDSETARALLRGRVPHALLFPSSGSVAVVAEYLESLRGTGIRPVVIAMGEASSEAAAASGFPPEAVAARAEVEEFVDTVTRALSELV